MKPLFRRHLKLILVRFLGGDVATEHVPEDAAREEFGDSLASLLIIKVGAACARGTHDGSLASVHRSGRQRRIGLGC